MFICTFRHRKQSKQRTDNGYYSIHKKQHPYDPNFGTLPANEMAYQKYNPTDIMDRNVPNYVHGIENARSNGFEPVYEKPLA